MATCNRHNLNYGNRDLCPACGVDAIDSIIGYIGGIRLSLTDAARTARACPCCDKPLSDEATRQVRRNLDIALRVSLEERAKAMKEVDAIRDRHRTTCPIDRAPDKDNAAVRLEDEYIRR